MGRALRGRDRVAPADVRLVDEALVAALDEREAVPEEVLRSGGRRRFRRNRPTVITRPVAIIGAGKLTVDVVVVGVGPFALGDGEDLVEIAVAVGPVALLDETPRRVVAESNVGEEASRDLPRVGDAALPVLAEEVPPTRGRGCGSHPQTHNVRRSHSHTLPQYPSKGSPFPQRW